MNVYILDGTENMFYSAVFFAYSDADCILSSAKNIQLTLDARIITVEYEEDKCERVKKKIAQYDPKALSDIALILKRGCDTKAMTALQYIRLILKNRAPVRDQLSHPMVI